MKKINWTPEAIRGIKRIANLDPMAFDQSFGVGGIGCACCFGAHLANEFKVTDTDGSHNFMTGWHFFSGLLGITSEELDICLVMAGAHEDYRQAISGYQWDGQPKIVLNKFLQMTHVPEMRA